MENEERDEADLLIFDSWMCKHYHRLEANATKMILPPSRRRLHRRCSRE